MTRAALVRVGGPLIGVANMWWVVRVSAARLTFDFVLYLVRCAPCLVSARADGQPG